MLIPKQEFASNTAVATEKGTVLCSQQSAPDEPDEIGISADFLKCGKCLLAYGNSVQPFRMGYGGRP